MKTFLFILAAISLCLPKTCSAQPPQWVTDLTNKVLDVELGQITHWEEIQMTWYNVNGVLDNSDSVRVNTLYIKGYTASGKFFIGAIPENNHVLNPLGSISLQGQTCTGECGCQCCNFRKDGSYGCVCNTASGQDCCVDQGIGCNCWCRHELTSGVPRN